MANRYDDVLKKLYGPTASASPEAQSAMRQGGAYPQTGSSAQSAPSRSAPGYTTPDYVNQFLTYFPKGDPSILGEDQMRQYTQAAQAQSTAGTPQTNAWYGTSQGRMQAGMPALGQETAPPQAGARQTPGAGQESWPPLAGIANRGVNTPGVGAPGTNAPAGAPQQPFYYGEGGAAYDPSRDAYSYWQTEDGKWWRGDRSGAIVALPQGPPWQRPTGQFTDPRLDALIDQLISMPYNREYVDLMGGQLRERLQGAAGTAREELANRLGAAGMFGGAAQSQLRGVDAATALGMSQGMGDIIGQAMNQAYQDRRAALGALGGRESQLLAERLGLGRLNLDELLGTTGRQLDLERLLQEGQQWTYETQIGLALALLQMAQNAEGEEAQRLYALALQLLYGGE